MDADDPRVLALAEVIRQVCPDLAHARALVYAHALVYAYDHAHAHAHYYASAHGFARASARAQLTDDQKASIDAAHALIFG